MSLEAAKLKQGIALIPDFMANDALASGEQARLNVEQKYLASELATSQENLAATEKRRLETADRLKKTQLEIYTLKAEVGDMVAELKRLKRAPAQPEPTQD